MKSGQNVNDIKNANRSLLLNLLYFGGLQSRKSLAEKSNLTAAAVTMIINELIIDGCVTETDRTIATGKSGRKEILIDINYKSHYILGISLGPEDCEVKLATLDGKVLGSKINAVIKNNDDLNMKTIAESCHEILNELSVPIEKVVCAGVTLRGIVDNENGVSINSYDILQSNCRIADDLSNYIKLPVVVENNVRAMLIADIILRHAKPVQSTLFIKYGPGIGGALLIGQNNYTGSSYRAIELGHICVEEDGELCICGKRGCLETVISFNAILKKAIKTFSNENTPVLYNLCDSDETKISIGIVFKAYESGDQGVIKIIDQSLKIFALSVSNFASLFDPETVLLSSQIFTNKIIVEKLQSEISAFSDNSAPRYMISASTNRLDKHGAISIAINSFLISGGQVLRRTNHTSVQVEYE